MRASKFQCLLCAKSGHYAVQQFDAVPTAVDADQEADLIIRRRQRIADDLASEVKSPSTKGRANIPLRVPCLRSGADQLGAEDHAALRIGGAPDH